MRVAVLTSGGDAPGMNMAVWAIARSCARRGWASLGVRHGLLGLKQGEVIALEPTTALGRARLGGTWLGTARLENFPTHLPDVLKTLQHHEIGALIVLGGNGSLKAAARLAEENVLVIGVPASIDNDVAGSAESLGFDTALNTGLVLADGIRDTAEALGRLFALVTLGGETGFLAQALAQASSADAALLPEAPLSSAELDSAIAEAVAVQGFALVVCSEGYPELREALEQAARHQDLRLRPTWLGHAQRGGSPSARDRLLAVTFAEAAAGAIEQGQSCIAGLRGAEVQLQAYGTTASKPLSLPLVHTA
jgi:6-phosphofructokinase 1